MGKPNPIEDLREVFKDKRIWIAVGKITKMEITSDHSVWRVKCNIYPENYEVIARMSWEMTTDEAGAFFPPIVGDVVLLGMDSEIDQIYVIKRLTSQGNKIPQQAVDGHVYVKAHEGKKTYIGSDTGTYIGKNENGSDPSENLVLGQELKTLLSYILNELKLLTDSLKLETHLGNLGAPTSVPVNAASYTTHGTNFNTKKTSPVDDSKILSNVAFTEKGS